jgi:hypothetical protein
MDSTLTAVISIISGAVGGSAAVSGLARWLGDRWLGKLLEKEKAEYAGELERIKKEFAQELEHYRARLDRSTFVTRAHFETEFTAMKDVSQSLSGVKLLLLDLYPIEVRPVNPKRDDLIAELESANQKFREKLEEWAVFLEPKLYVEFDHCYAAAHALCREEKSFEGKPKEGSKKYFWDAYQNACQMVRDRIQCLAVLPSN